jgi:hypothetical protein
LFKYYSLFIVNQDKCSYNIQSTYNNFHSKFVEKKVFGDLDEQEEELFDEEELEETEDN